jgi:hypothetical protein
VDAGAHPRPVVRAPHAGQPPARLQHRLDGVLGFHEGGHQAVAQPLHDPPAAIGDRRLDGLAHVAQQLEGHRVARLQRPAGEVHEVGEHDGQLGIAAPAALELGHLLPHLQRAQPELAQHARRLRRELR